MLERISGIINQKASEFPSNFTWLNIKQPLTLAKLKGHVIVLDFWTYCCINCMHILPELAKIEKKFHDKPVVVIGVHSAKFFNEQNAENIREAIARYEIEHPVIVDKNMQIWQRYHVRSWPTFVIIDPMRNVVYETSGEGQRENLEDVIEILLSKHAKAGTLAENPIRLEQPEIKDVGILSFPGKISFSSDGKMIAISDSNHNRIVIVDLGGKIRDIIGSGKRGFSDGSFQQASFFRPQGVFWHADKIYVTDTENHALREIDLHYKKVNTLAGTGKQAQWMALGGDGRSSSLSSPWDIAYEDDKIYIAMAGNHQIWVYDIKSEKITPFAGSGYENIVDADNLQDAQFAQPSGLSIDGKYLYVADSEVSGIRRIDLESKIVRTIVGTGLFVFGHKDGNLTEAKFQHPLGVHASNNGIYVADTYNHAIRLIDIENDAVSTLVGKLGVKTVCRLDDPDCDTLELFEPSDVKLHENKLYIADTNNHLIRIFDLEKKVLSTMKIKT